MAWSTPLTAVSNAALTAAQWNASVRDNLLQTAAAKATTVGSYFAVTGANALAERKVQYDYVATSETTTSSSAADLTTAGPSVTLTASGAALVVLSASLFNNTAGATSAMGVDISGATTVAVSAATALRLTAGSANAGMEASFVLPLSLTAGSTTFAAKYFVSSGSTGTYQHRRMTVMPF